MSKNYDNYLKEVTKTFESCGRAYTKKELESDNTHRYPIKYLPRKTDWNKFEAKTKKGFSFSNLEVTEQAKIWSYIFKNTKYLSIGHMSIDFFKKFQKKKNHSLYQYWSLLKTWCPKIDNWQHADMIASLYCDILSEKPIEIYPELLKWSQTKSPWKNRMAIVSLLYYYNPRRHLLPFKKIIKLVTPHLGSDHYYLQKAIGWNLRELNNSYPREYWQFMQKNVLKISSTAFSTSVEKLERNKKEKLKTIRKEARKKK